MDRVKIFLVFIIFTFSLIPIISSTRPSDVIDLTEWILVAKEETFLLRLDFRFMPLSFWTLAARVEEEEVQVDLDTSKVVVTEKRKSEMVSGIFDFVLNATTQLYKRLCPSVRRSVCPVLFSDDKFGRF